MMIELGIPSLARAKAQVLNNLQLQVVGTLMEHGDETTDPNQTARNLLDAIQDSWTRRVEQILTGSSLLDDSEDLEDLADPASFLSFPLSFVIAERLWVFDLAVDAYLRGKG